MDILWMGGYRFLVRGKMAKVDLEMGTVKIEKSDSSPFVIGGPGEYEISGISVFGISTQESGSTVKNTAYVIDIDNIKIGYLGKISQKLTEKQLADIGEVEILMLGTGTTNDLEAKLAVDVVGQIVPKIVIPTNSETAGQFLIEMGVSEVATQPKLVVTKDKLPDQLQIVLLERRAG